MPHAVPNRPHPSPLPEFRERGGKGSRSPQVSVTPAAQWGVAIFCGIRSTAFQPVKFHSLEGCATLSRGSLPQNIVTPAQWTSGKNEENVRRPSYNPAVPLAGFHSTIGRWFQQRFGEPTEPQREGWPKIRAGHPYPDFRSHRHGENAGGVSCRDRQPGPAGPALADQTSVLYVSPLRALSNDVQKNLQGPLRELAELDPDFPQIRVLVRTGDTPQRDRAAMLRKPPHILVTTPESLYILLTSAGGREMLRTVRTVIVDEIHALARDKRGSHLALSLERLEALAGADSSASAYPPRKSRWKKSARFLVGVGRDCTLVDVGHRRKMDVAIVVPPSPLSTVCSHEQWDEIYGQIAGLIGEHRTTLIFVNTRKLAERITARLTEVLGEEKVTCHHSSLSKERRLDAEHRLKSGTLRALVATASLELGIDIGDVDLVIQVGATRSIATFLQRVGRSGHAVRRIPKGPAVSADDR